jgi:hypothetical protein
VNNQVKKNRVIWLIYVALIISGVILIGDALKMEAISKLTIRLGVGLIFSALALITGKDRPAGIISIAILWIAILISFFN